MGGHDDKTEKATPQRRKQARREGQIARSQEIGVALSLGALALSVQAFLPAAADTLRRDTIDLLRRPPMDPQQFGEVGREALGLIVALAGPLVGVCVAVAIIGGVVQTRGGLATKAAKPKLSHLSPARGLQRLKPGAAIWELARTVIKLGLLAAVVMGPVQEYVNSPVMARGLDQGLSVVFGQVETLLMRGLMVAALVAALDYVYNLRKIGKQLKMSKEEIKQEYKQQEGDPHVKGHRKRRAMELSRGRMLVDTALADVVVTNPTHLAVALRFADGEAAPRVVAKGADHLAAKIRTEAYRNGVPVRQDVPLARTLYRSVKVGQYVPAALYEAVAVVLAYAYRVRGRVAA